MRREDGQRFKDSNPTIPEEFSDFFSDDPYAVLSVERDTPIKEIKDRARKLISSYNPKKFPEGSRKNRHGGDIIRQIKNAVKKIEELRKSEVKLPEAPEEIVDLKKELITNFEILLSSYLGRVEEYSKFLTEWKNLGIDDTDIDQAFKKKNIQQRIEDLFFNSVETAALMKDPSVLEKYIKNWGDVGLNLVSLKKSEKVPQIIKRKIIFSFGVPNNTPEYIRDSIETWRRVGIDVSDIAREPVLIVLIKNAAEEKVATSDLDDFLEYCDKWLQVGVDVMSLVSFESVNRLFRKKIVSVITSGNSHEFGLVQKKLEKRGFNLVDILNSDHSDVEAAFINKVRGIISDSFLEFIGKKKAKDFIRQWGSLGYVPSKKVLSLL